MREQLRLLSDICMRLEQVATVFSRLAQLHIDRRRSVRAENNPSDMPTKGSGIASQSRHAAGPTLWTTGSMADDIQQVQEDLAVDGEIDLDAFMNWLPADIFAPWSWGLKDQQYINESAIDNETPSASMDKEPQQAPHGTKRSFSATFDWFAWDSHHTKTF